MSFWYLGLPQHWKWLIKSPGASIRQKKKKKNRPRVRVGSVNYDHKNVLITWESQSGSKCFQDVMSPTSTVAYSSQIQTAAASIPHTDPPKHWRPLPYGYTHPDTPKVTGLIFSFTGHKTSLFSSKNIFFSPGFLYQRFKQNFRL